MRIVIEIEGAEISITAREVGSKGAPDERLLAPAVTGEALDAGAAPSLSMLSGSEPLPDQGIVTTVTGAGAMDAGQAPDIPATSMAPSPAAPVVSASDDGEAIDAGAAKFTPPDAEAMGGA
jgi:hypothetical protein